MFITARLKLNGDRGVVIFSSTGEVFHNYKDHNVGITYGEARFLLEQFGFTKLSKQYHVDGKLSTFVKAYQVIEQHVATPIDFDSLHQVEVPQQPPELPQEDYWS